MSAVLGPAPRPCDTCPYRLDVPSGVWAEEEYRKLPRFDLPTGQQPPAVFACHSAPERVCAGWCGTHDMDETLALRFAVLDGRMTPEVLDECRDYVSPVPLFASGAEAAEHGLSGVKAPGPDAEVAIGKLTRRRVARRAI